MPIQRFFGPKAKNKDQEAPATTINQEHIALQEQDIPIHTKTDQPTPQVSHLLRQIIPTYQEKYQNPTVMEIRFDRHGKLVLNYDNKQSDGIIVIDYHVPDPSNNEYLRLTSFLPLTSEGKKILVGLVTAFKAGKLLKVTKNQIKSAIQQKTQTYGGGTYGWPDPEYLESAVKQLQTLGYYFKYKGNEPLDHGEYQVRMFSEQSVNTKNMYNRLPQLSQDGQ